MKHSPGEEFAFAEKYKAAAETAKIAGTGALKRKC
jgi:hypothetical protein